MDSRFIKHHVAQPFFLTRPSRSIFPHSYTNSPLIRSEKCDFSSPSCVSLPCPIPSPLPGADPASRPPLPPPRPPSNPGKKRPTPELRLGLISSAHLEAGWGLTGDHEGPRPWSVGCEQRCDTQRGQRGTQLRAPPDIQYMLQQPWADQA